MTSHGGASLQVTPLKLGRLAELAAEITCPPDKSVTHRSVMLAGMAKGVSTVLNPLLGADCRATMGVFKALGVKVEIVSDPASAPLLTVDSPGWDAWKSPLMPLDFANSGTSARLLAGIFAATPDLFVTCFGDASLSQRPMGRVVTPLRQIGANIWGREDGKFLPLAINGSQLRPASHSIDKATAQVKSALLLAGLNIDGTTTVSLPAGSRDHSERMLQNLGARLTTERQGSQEVIQLKGPFRPPARAFSVPGDPSSAAFFAVYAAITAGRVAIRGVLDNPTRTGFLTVLERMGARLTRSAAVREGGLLEPVFMLTVQGGAELKAIDMEPELAPTLIDEIPILAVAALAARGRSRFRGLAELRVKESDRLVKTVELLTAAGAKAWTEGDDLCVEGTADSQNREAPATAFNYDPAYDHRLAMAAGVLAKVARGVCTIKDPGCVAVSFPGFFDVLASLG